MRQIRFVDTECDLAKNILKLVNQHLARKGLLLKRRSIVGATIITAPSSTMYKSASATPRFTRPKRAVAKQPNGLGKHRTQKEEHRTANIGATVGQPLQVITRQSGLTAVRFKDWPKHGPCLSCPTCGWRARIQWR